MASNKTLQEINLSGYFINNTKEELNKIELYMKNQSKHYDFLKKNIDKFLNFPNDIFNNVIENIKNLVKWLETIDKFNKEQNKEIFIEYYNKLSEQLKEYNNKICILYNNQFIIKIKEFNEIIENIILNLNEFSPPNINNDSNDIIEFNSKLEQSDPFYEDCSKYNDFYHSDYNISQISQNTNNNNNEESNNFNCFTHPEKKGVYYCNHCDFIICEECMQKYKSAFGHNFEKIDKIKEDNFNKKNKFLNSFMKIIKNYIQKCDSILKYNKEFLIMNKIEFPLIKNELDFESQMIFFENINKINKKILENNDTINNILNESKITDIILSNCIKSIFENLVGDTFDYGKKIEEIENDFVIDEKFEKGDDGQENNENENENENTEYDDIIKNKFLYIINIINKANYNYNNTEFNKQILEEISSELNIDKKNISIVNNNKRAFINYFIKTKIFEKLSLKELRINYPNLKFLYEYKLLIVFFISECKISKELFDFKYNFITPNSSLNNRRGKEKYYPPYGWIGIGLNVNNKFDKKDNSWLNKNDILSEWAIGYYLFKNLNSDEIIIKLNNIIMNNDLYLNEQFQIKIDYFNKRNNGKKTQRIGKGYYLCSDISIAEKNTGYIIFNNKKYKILLMAKVLIKSIREPDDCSFWIIPEKEHIRIYRILLKEF